MKTINKYLTTLIILVMMLSACNQNTIVTPTAEPTVTLPLPSPNVSFDSVPDVEAAAREYMDLWVIEDYQQMYDRLSRLTKDAVTIEAFEASHRDTAIKLTMQEIDYQILSSMLNITTAQVSYQIEYETALMGNVSRQTIMNLILEDGSWHVQWDSGMMLPELAGGNYLELVIEVPARGNIYASDTSNNYPLVSFEDVVTITVTPGNIDEETEGDMVRLLGNSDAHGRKHPRGIR
ncbi:MAG: NTF2-like N-terminal transpeptidase domain-containing protein [Anaerolineaceae bacterium]